MTCAFIIYTTSSLGPREALRFEPIMVFLKQIIIICNLPNDFFTETTYTEREQQ